VSLLGVVRGVVLASGVPPLRRLSSALRLVALQLENLGAGREEEVSIA